MSRKKWLMASVNDRGQAKRSVGLRNSNRRPKRAEQVDASIRTRNLKPKLETTFYSAISSFMDFKALSSMVRWAGLVAAAS